MQVDDLMKVCFSIGVTSSMVVPDQYVVPPSELERTQNRLVNTIKRESKQTGIEGYCKKWSWKLGQCRGFGVNLPAAFLNL